MKLELHLDLDRMVTGQHLEILTPTVLATYRLRQLGKSSGDMWREMISCRSRFFGWCSRRITSAEEVIEMLRENGILPFDTISFFFDQKAISSLPLLTLIPKDVKKLYQKDSNADLMTKTLIHFSVKNYVQSTISCTQKYRNRVFQFTDEMWKCFASIPELVLQKSKDLKNTFQEHLN